MNRFSGQMTKWAVLTCFIILLSGCAAGGLFLREDWGMGNVRKWTALSWENAYRYSTSRYAVVTDTSMDVAMFIGEYMEQAAEELARRFGAIPDQQRLRIHAYANRKDYENAVRRLVDRPEVTAGMYSPDPPGVIYLSYVYFHKSHPSTVLLHEGTHQYMHQALGFSIPNGWKSVFPEEKHLLISVPVWLNEGMAAFMEAGSVPGQPPEFGKLHTIRLRHLQRMIRSGKCPPLSSLLQKPYGSRLRAADYSAFWGIVQYLLEIEPTPQKSGGDRFGAFTEACRNGFFFRPETEFPAAFTINGKPVPDFDRQWYRRLAQASFADFQRIFLSGRQSLHSWESDWHQWILDR